MVPSGIDKTKIMLQLEQLEKHLKRLSEIKNRLERSVDDYLVLAAAERLLQLAIEDCLNIAGHLVAGLGLVRADTYRELFTRLKESKIISVKLGDIMEGFASFRNRLVHLYAKVSPEEVMAKLVEAEILSKFAKEIVEYIGKDPSDK